MSIILKRLSQELSDNPYATFDSDGKGVSRVFDLSWDFHALHNNKTNIGFEHIDKHYREDIQSYLYALIKWQKANSNDGSHAAVSTLISYKSKLNALAITWQKSDFSLLSSDREWKTLSRSLIGFASEGRCRGLASIINALNKAGLVDRYVHKQEYVKWIKEQAAIGQAIDRKSTRLNSSH